MDCSNYHWTLYSAGPAQLDVNKDAIKEDMIPIGIEITVGY